MSPGTFLLPAPDMASDIWLGFRPEQGESEIRFASVAQVKDQLSAYLAQAQRGKRPIVVTHHGKPYTLIQPITEGDLEALGWGQLAKQRLADAWEGEDDALYDYL